MVSCTSVPIAAMRCNHTRSLSPSWAKLTSRHPSSLRDARPASADLTSVQQRPSGYSLAAAVRNDLLVSSYPAKTTGGRTKPGIAAEWSSCAMRCPRLMHLMVVGLTPAAIPPLLDQHLASIVKGHADQLLEAQSPD